MKILNFIFLFTITLGVTSCKTGEKISKPNQDTRGFYNSNLSEKENLTLQGLFFEANRAKILNNPEKSVELFNQCLKIDPNHAASLYELSIVYISMQKDELAFQSIKKAAKVDPTNIWYKSLLANFYERNNQFGEAAVLYESIAQQNPSDLDNFDRWARALIYNSQLNKAIDVYNKMENKLGINEQLSLQKQKIYTNIKDNDKAELEIEKLVEANPNSAKFHKVLAELYMKNGKDEKSIIEFNKVLDLDPDDAYVHLSLFEYYERIGNKDRAAKEMDLAFNNPNLSIDSKIRLYLNRYFSSNGIKPELIDEGNKVGKSLTTTHPTEAKAFSVYGDFMYRLDSLEPARYYYREAIKLDESKALIWNQVMLINSTLQDFKSMYAESTSAMELFPAQPSFYLFKGIAAIQTNNVKDGIESLEQGKNLVIDNPPLSAQFYSSLGDAYHSDGNNLMSDSAYRQSLSFDPNNIYVLNNYSYYLSLRKEDLERAAKMSKKSNELSPKSASFMDTYAWILFQQEKYTDAKLWQEKAINSGGKSATIYEHYGDILYKLKDVDGAVKYWKQAQETGKGSNNLLDKIAKETYIE